MDIKIITSKSYKKTEWSGGTTTELYIYPEQAVFKDGNYDFRLSIATVEIEASIFTKLEGVKRTLMVLEGQIKLSHQDHHERELKKFDSDQFSGDWTTKCVGTCTDFNLMTKGQTSGTITPIIAEKSCELQLSSDQKFTFFYLHKGLVNMSIENQVIDLNQGELLIVSSPGDTIISLSSDELSELLLVDIQ